MSTNHEVLGNYDYEWARKEKLRPKSQHEPRLLGRVARLLFEETTVGKIKGAVEGMAAWWKKKRAEARQEKEDRKYNGSLAEIQHTIVPLEEEYHMPPEYQGRHRREDIPNPAETPEHISDDMAEVMHKAVERAQRSLGKLPVISLVGQPPSDEPHIPRQATRENALKPDEIISPAPTAETDNSFSGDMSDEVLIARLNKAYYTEPAVTPPHEQESGPGRHRAERQHRRGPRTPIIQHRDDLTSTKGK